METRIQLTHMHWILIETDSDTSDIYIVTKKNGKETKDFYAPHTLRTVQNWYKREREAHAHTLQYVQEELIDKWDIGAKLLSGEYTPGGEVEKGYTIYL